MANDKVINPVDFITDVHVASHIAAGDIESVKHLIPDVVTNVAEYHDVMKAVEDMTASKEPGDAPTNTYPDTNEPLVNTTATIDPDLEVTD